MNKIIHLFIVWKKIASLSLQDHTLSFWGALAFLVGKVVRFILLLIFLSSVISASGSLAGYSVNQVIVFFLVFNIVDITAQSIFRGVYDFRQSLLFGSFDYDILKPLPTYFRPLFGKADVVDMLTLIPLWIGFLLFLFKNGSVDSPLYVFVFALTMVISMVIAFAFHLFVCAIGIISTEVDHIIWVYRDLIGMGRFPTDIYPKAIRFALTFFVPVVILITIPAKGLMGLLSFSTLIICSVVTILFLFFSLWFWKKALGRYASASS